MNRSDITGENFSVTDEEDSDLEEDLNPHATPEREILWACEKGKEDLVVQILSQHPECVNAVDKDDYTPLHRAAYSNYLHIIKVLLEKGASVDAKTADGWTPLHSACRWNNYDCALALINAGSNINAQTNSGQTPLHLAASYRESLQTIKLLLSNPLIEPSTQNSNGETAKDIALRCGPNGHIFKVTDPVLSVILEK